MLSIQQAHVALAAEVETTSLMINLHPDSNYILISAIESMPIGIHLDGNQKYNSFQSNNNFAYRGLVLNDFDIEFDVSSVFDANTNNAKGALIYQSGMISIDSSISGRDFLFPISRTFHSIMYLGFSKWSIVLGPPTRRQKLMEFDVSACLNRDR